MTEALLAWTDRSQKTFLSSWALLKLQYLFLQLWAVASIPSFTDDKTLAIGSSSYSLALLPLPQDAGSNVLHNKKQFSPFPSWVDFCAKLVEQSSNRQPDIQRLSPLQYRSNKIPKAIFNPLWSKFISNTHTHQQKKGNMHYIFN